MTTGTGVVDVEFALAITSRYLPCEQFAAPCARGRPTGLRAGSEPPPTPSSADPFSTGRTAGPGQRQRPRVRDAAELEHHGRAEPTGEDLTVDHEARIAKDRSSDGRRAVNKGRG